MLTESDLNNLQQQHALASVMVKWAQENAPDISGLTRLAHNIIDRTNVANDITELSVAI